MKFKERKKAKLKLIYLHRVLGFTHFCHRCLKFTNEVVASVVVVVVAQNLSLVLAVSHSVCFNMLLRTVFLSATVENARREREKGKGSPNPDLNCSYIVITLGLFTLREGNINLSGVYDCIAFSWTG